MELTKDADKLICSLYKVYLERRKKGIDKVHAKNFEITEIQSIVPWSISDIKATIAEISRIGLGTMYYSGDFYANDNFIIYMENRFKNGLNEVVDFISKLIP